MLLAVSGGLLDELLAVDEDESLGGVGGSGVGEALDQLGEDDGLATSSSQRNAHPTVAEVNVLENGLNALFLVISKLERTGGGSGGGGQRTE